MPLTVLAIFLAFAAPAPTAESTFALEDEALVELCRTVRRRAPIPPRAAAVTPPRPRPALPQEEPQLRRDPPAGWTPGILSRPPPL